MRRFVMESQFVWSYKKSFIYRRLFETFLGGLRLCASDNVPGYVYLMQFVLFSGIPSLSILFIVLEHCEFLTLNQAVYTCALVKFGYAFLLQIVAFIIRKQKTEVVEPVVEEAESPSDEEVFHFDSPFGPKTWTFLIRQKSMALNIIIHPFVVGVVGAGAVLYIRPNNVMHINVPMGLAIAFCVMGILTVAIGLWPLIGGPPPEPATYRPLCPDASAFSRPAHMIICIFIHLLTGHFPDAAWLYVLDVFFHLIFATSPILWLLGILPPIDALALWLSEQWQVVALGGSPAASNIRLVGQVAFGTIFLCIAAVMPTFETLMICSSCLGFLLSVDFVWMMSSLLPHRGKLMLRIFGMYKESQLSTRKLSLQRVNCRRELALYVMLFLIAFGISISCQIPHLGWYKTAINTTEVTINTSTTNKHLGKVPPLFQVSMRGAVGAVVVILATLMLIVNEIQKVFILGLIRNPLYMTCKRLPKMNPLYILSQFILIGGPLVCLLFIHQVVSAEALRQFSFPVQSFLHLLHTIPLLRILRQIWQFPQTSLLQLSLFYFIELIFQGSSIGLYEFWSGLAPATRLFCISLSYLWGTRLLQRLCSVIVYMMMSATEEEQHVSLACFLVLFNIFLLPVLLGVLVLSSVTAAPLLPLFTLPVFFLGFPRPLKFWSYPAGRASNICDDTIYYEKIAPQIIQELHRVIQGGGLGIVEPGEHFLLRFDDRFVWIQVLECGFTYMYYSVKGLELQETSCHRHEASRVDEIFTAAFDFMDGPKNRTASFANPYALYTLTPLSQINITGYSDTKNVLNGVLNSPDTLNIINSNFQKALLYVLMEHMIKKHEITLPDLDVTNLPQPGEECPLQRSRDVLRTLPKVEKKDLIIGTIPHAAIVRQRVEEEPSSIENHGSNNSSPEELPRQEVDHMWNDTTSDLGMPVTYIDLDILIDNESENSLGNLNDETVEEDLPANQSENDSPSTLAKLIDRSKMVDHMVNDTTSDLGIHVTCIELDILKNMESENSSSNLNDETVEEDLATQEEDNRPSTSANPNDTDFPMKIIEGLMFDDSLNLKSATTSCSPPLNVEYKNKTPAETMLKKHHAPVYKSSLSAALAPLPSWFLDLSYEIEDLEKLWDSFPVSWFRYLLEHFGRTHFNLKQQYEATSSQLSAGSVDEEIEIKKLQCDKDLEESYKIIIATCNLVIMRGEMTGRPTPHDVYQTFMGNLCDSVALNWLISKQELFILVMKAYRIGVKLSFDHTLIGSIADWAELKTSIDDYSCNWFFGPDEKSANRPPTSSHRSFKEPMSWLEAIRNDTPNLLSMSVIFVSKSIAYMSRFVTSGEVKVSIGRLSGETVRGLWASLGTELLYLTNDDDERYSLQAQPGLLRNLTVQAADPPLGYPIFSSRPLCHTIPWLSPSSSQTSYESKSERVTDIL